MKYLGIDYGVKNVGIAVSDDGGNLAFAKTILKNDQNLLETVAKLCMAEKISAIVIGESLDFKGEPNPLLKAILNFKRKLATRTSLPIFLEPEFLTSAEAEHLQDKDVKIDASAAALILKSYLDKNSN